MKHLNPIKVTRLMALSVALLLVANATSCKRAAEKTQEKIIEKAIGDKANVDLDDEKIVIETEEGTFTTDAKIQSWPKEIPNDIPEFKEGNIVVVNTQDMGEGKNWVVIYEDVSQEAIEDYKKELERNDFKINFTTRTGTGTQFAAEKGNLMVMLTGAEGGASISVSLEN